MRYLILLLLFLSGLRGVSQNTEEQLAAQYFMSKEYDKALIYYEKLYSKNPKAEFYKYYLECLLETRDFKGAEKLVKKKIKQDPTALNYLVDLGWVYQREDREKDSQEQYQKAISLLKQDNNQIFVIAKSFIAIKQFDLAIETYQKGRKLMRGSYPFNFEIAQIHGYKGNYQAMFQEILEVLTINEQYRQSVEDALLPFFEDGQNEARIELIRTEILKQIQKNPDKVVYSEILVWMLNHLKDFEASFVQSKALDKRLKEDGGRLMKLGETCIESEAYDVAIKCYEYVLGKGPGNPYHLLARLELLNARYVKVVARNEYTQKDLVELESQFQLALKELGKSSSTVLLIRNLAHIQAFYLGKTEEPINLLTEAKSLVGLSASALAEVKLELADILLFSGDVWEASLLYSQVEKAFKHDPIGHEAKFRNARLSFFIGDFAWAQSQLEALKGATSKLISNDALDLSLIIADNTTLDTNPLPLQIYARADLLFFRARYDDALKTLDSIQAQFPNHSLGDEILFKKYQIAMRRNNFAGAKEICEKIMKDYPKDLFGDDACFRLAELYEFRFADIENAKKYYQLILTDYPGSLFSVEARKRFRKLRGDQVN
jgi:tetratricopeptide (TPR) repeat protein